MKTQIQILALTIIAVMTISCKSGYKVADFDEATANHVSVAVLPVKA